MEGEELYYRRSGSRFVRAEPFPGWPEPGVYVVDGTNGRRIDRLGGVPDPMLSASVFAYQYEATLAVSSLYFEGVISHDPASVVERVFEAIARAEHDRLVASGVERALESGHSTTVTMADVAMSAHLPPDAPLSGSCASAFTPEDLRIQRLALAALTALVFASISLVVVFIK